MHQDQLNKQLKLHTQWFNGNPDGIKGDLTGQDLRNLDLSNTDLRKIVLDGADLRGANLFMTNLMYASLKGVNLSETVLQSTIMTGADLAGANLSGAKLSYVSLGYSNLTGVDLSRAVLSACEMREAVMINVIVDNDTLFMTALKQSTTQSVFDEVSNRGAEVFVSGSSYEPRNCLKMMREAYAQLKNKDVPITDSLNVFSKFAAADRKLAHLCNPNLIKHLF